MSNQVYGYITDKIMQELERGCCAVAQAVENSADGVRVPTSFVSKKPYRGVNTFLLALARFKAGLRFKLLANLQADSDARRKRQRAA